MFQGAFFDLVCHDDDDDTASAPPLRLFARPRLAATLARSASCYCTDEFAAMRSCAASVLAVNYW